MGHSGREGSAILPGAAQSERTVFPLKLSKNERIRPNPALLHDEEMPRKVFEGLPMLG